MSPIQQMLLGVGAVATKTYVDDIFSTYIYEGTGSAGNQVNNGIDVSGEGGMVWIKPRDTGSHYIVDSERNNGAGILNTNNSSASANNGNLVSSLNSNGFTLGSLGNANTDGDSYASWTFRKAPGFFDVVTYTGDGNTSKQVSHSLGCVPGIVIVKCTSNESASMSWYVYHRTIGNTKGYYLNGVGSDTNSGFWNNTSPTSTHFTVSDADPDAVTTNKDGATYVAYLFAGGESTAATARSVDFDGNDYLTIPPNSDTLLNGDFTVEFWYKPDSASGSRCMCGIGNWTDTNGFAFYTVNNTFSILKGNSYKIEVDDSAPVVGQWSHVALVRSGSTVNLYVNGISIGSCTDSVDYGSDSGQGVIVGGAYESGSADYEIDGKISNLRVVKGTALYTSSFRPPTEPLTNVTNTKVLCCNNSSTTGSTVTPGTITANGDPTASTDSPFDDPDGFKFGDAKESVIKCGSYIGNGNTDGPEVHLGWEPAFLIVKNTVDAEGWVMFDEMRGMHAGGDDKALFPNQDSAEQNRSTGQFWPTPTGFKLDGSSDGKVNGDGKKYMFLAVRRSDGYVGKPVELGTSVFAMDTGSDSTTIPTYDSGFPVDFSISRTPASSGNWFTGARLMSGKTLYTNTVEAESSRDFSCYDSNLGFDKDTWGPGSSTYQAWMFKRHAGFDVVGYTGDGVDGRWINHSMNAAPEMIWIKRRSTTGQWVVGHKGLDGGNAPWTHYLTLETGDSENDYPLFHDTAPTSTHFKVNGHAEVNGDDKTFIAILFSSVSGVSKVGYYTGNGTGSSSTQTITTGFQPRFLLLKNVTDNGEYWQMLDTTRGWTSSSNKRIYPNDNRAQDDNKVIGEPLSTGFTVTDDDDGWNKNNSKYIYYAHA